MYPPEDVLAEIGRVTIAGSRLDVELSLLWHLLDPTFEGAGKKSATLEERSLAARRYPDVEIIRALGHRQLETDGLDNLDAALDDQAEAREQRNDVVHDEWAWQGSVPIAEPDDVRGRRSASAEQFHRWLRLPRASVEYARPQSLEELRIVEHALRHASEDVKYLREAIATWRLSQLEP